jgi:murein DD-endopeptidase MepM/ murein hydrolase activator NlpD
LPKAFNHDFSDRSSNGSPLRSGRRKGSGFPSPDWFPLLGAALGFIFILVLISTGGDEVDANSVVPYEEWLPPALNQTTENPARIQTTKLKSGDNAISALGRLGFDASESHNIINAAKKSYGLKNIRAGRTFKRHDSAAGIDIYYNIDGTSRLHLHQAKGQPQWQAQVEKRETHSHQLITSGVVHGSLFSAAADAGLDQRTIMNLVDIFAWDIDFARDMRDGDTFHVLYEERFDDEGKPLESRILAAEFTNQGKTYKAVRYKQLNGNVNYFSPDGKSMRKAYLRAPLKFSRISSRFRLKRKHPVLGYNRAHRGVDYAAASGTPIHAIGDGYIAYIGWKGGYGRFILIRHNNRNHSTAYAHMRRYARGMKKGKRVKQGQIIGYVGMSGLATGPHLHFEFRSRGRAVNPLTIKHPPAKPVLKTERTRFYEQTAPLLSRLNNSTSQPNWG